MRAAKRARPREKEREKERKKKIFSARLRFSRDLSFFAPY